MDVPKLCHFHECPRNYHPSKQRRLTQPSSLMSSPKHGPSFNIGSNTRPTTLKTKLTNTLQFGSRLARPSSHTTTKCPTITGKSQLSSCGIGMTFTTQKNSSWDKLPKNTRSSMQLESRLTTGGGSKFGDGDQWQFTSFLGTIHLSPDVALFRPSIMKPVCGTPQMKMQH